MEAVSYTHLDVYKRQVWNDKARCLGITCETRSDIYNVLFKNCDILHSYPKWAMELGSLCVIVCDLGHIHDIVFEDIRIAHEDHYAVCVAQMKDFWSCLLYTSRCV